MKLYKTKVTAKNAVRRQALQMMNYKIEPHCSSLGTGFTVMFYVRDTADYNDIVGRGFRAKIDPDNAV